MIKDQINRAKNFWVTSSGAVNREAPAQAELRPTCAGLDQPVPLGQNTFSPLRL
jgi:hypothetical protein